MAIAGRQKETKAEKPAANAIPHRLLYSVQEARQLWGGIAQSTFYKLVNEQNIRLIKLGRRTYVPRDEIMRVAGGSGDV